MLIVQLKKSLAGLQDRQKATLQGLGLRRFGRTVTLENTPAVRGMVKRVIQFIDVRESD